MIVSHSLDNLEGLIDILSTTTQATILCGDDGVWEISYIAEELDDEDDAAEE